MLSVAGKFVSSRHFGRWMKKLVACPVFVLTVFSHGFCFVVCKATQIKLIIIMTFTIPQQICHSETLGVGAPDAPIETSTFQSFVLQLAAPSSCLKHPPLFLSYLVVMGAGCDRGRQRMSGKATESITCIPLPCSLSLSLLIAAPFF